MFWIVVIIIGVIIGVINEYLKSTPASQQAAFEAFVQEALKEYFHPEIHYQKISERGKTYLRKICLQNAPYAKGRLEILLDFTSDGYSVFLLKNEKGKHFLRSYICSENPDGIDRYVLHNVMSKIFSELQRDETSRMNRYCMDVFGKPASECNINLRDSENTQESNINAYAVLFSEKVTSYDEAARIMETKVLSVSSDRDDDEELDDFDPDIDEVPEGYKLNEFGELEPDTDLPEDPNRWGSEAWWKEQEGFINDSLYVNHDWDIFKKDKDEDK